MILIPALARLCAAGRVSHMIKACSLRIADPDSLGYSAGASRSMDQQLSLTR